MTSISEQRQSAVAKEPKVPLAVWIDEPTTSDSNQVHLGRETAEKIVSEFAGTGAVFVSAGASTVDVVVASVRSNHQTIFGRQPAEALAAIEDNLRSVLGAEEQHLVGITDDALSELDSLPGVSLAVLGDSALLTQASIDGVAAALPDGAILAIESRDGRTAEGFKNNAGRIVGEARSSGLHYLQHVVVVTDIDGPGTDGFTDYTDLLIFSKGVARV